MKIKEEMKERLGDKAKNVVTSIRQSLSDFDVDKCIEQLKVCKPLAEKDLKHLCKYVRTL